MLSKQVSKVHQHFNDYSELYNMVPDKFLEATFSVKWTKHILMDMLSYKIVWIIEW
jgi:hypothetical protein